MNIYGTMLLGIELKNDKLVEMKLSWSRTIAKWNIVFCVAKISTDNA